ncbi:unnamed protein product [Rotaria socialis]|uniref:Uncharacterized protein n=2 Tax=Rotaria socialis TaxID=392032 RepID=A0A820GCE7_9BILA|nr:unnamed protein product [Rotaria socialis]
MVLCFQFDRAKSNASTNHFWYNSGGEGRDWRKNQIAFRASFLCPGLFCTLKNDPNVDHLVIRRNLYNSFLPIAKKRAQFSFWQRDPSKLIIVVGNGTSSSCNQNSLSAAFLKGGIIAFNCGGQLVIVAINIESQISKALRGGDTTINLATGNGGAISSDGRGRNNTICGIKLTENQANKYGGAFFRVSYNGDEQNNFAAVLVDNNFITKTENGLAADSAGGLSLANEKPVTLNRVNVLDNKAYTGLGAAAFSFCSTLGTFSNSVITNNIVGNP